MALDPNTTNTITSWYKDYLGRDPDAEGLNFWSNAASTGGADSLKKSFLDAAISNSTTGVEKSPTKGILSNIYTKDFGREADQPGLNFWDNGASAGGTKIATDMFEAAKSYKPETKPKVTPTPIAATTLDTGSLERRAVNPATETVAGQMKSILAEDGPYIQQSRNRTTMAANSRGLVNSSIAAGAGEDAAISSALNIAAPDAATYSKASDYNAALINQAKMYNADALNKFGSQQMGIDADREARADQAASQLTLAQLQSETSRYVAEKSNATSKYNTDAATKDTVERNKLTLVNNIIQNSELSPDRKAALLTQLGESGLASAIYVVQDTAADLNPAATQVTG